MTITITWSWFSFFAGAFVVPLILVLIAMSMGVRQWRNSRKATEKINAVLDIGRNVNVKNPWPNREDIK